MPVSRILCWMSVCLFVGLLALPAVNAQEPVFSMQPVGANFFLDKPWDLSVGPDGYLWVTEREMGRVVRVNPETAERDDLLQLSDHTATASQDGLLGMALHPDFQTDSPFVYLSYTYLVLGERTQKIVRFTYSQTNEDGSLGSPLIILDSLPASNDHNSGRLIFGPDQKLYYTIGDQGGNQFANFCNPILSQVLPTQAEIDQHDWAHYPGKVLRINTDGSIPSDNPLFDGVQSHIYTYGHRNAQGIVFGFEGRLYSSEHGPITDDEVNQIVAGGNYGWPHVAGFQDDQVYDYCNWSAAADCESLNYSATCPPDVALEAESSFSDSAYQEPLFSLFAVPDDYYFNNPACQSSWICRPNIAPSGLAFYGSDSLPEWKNSLLVASLKRGRIYQLKLDSAGTAVVGDTLQHFYTPNRYRDVEVSPDGKTIYILTGETGRVSDLSGLNIVNTSDLQNPANILAFTLQDSSSQVSVRELPPFQISPNPSQGWINLSLEIPAHVTLLDLSGRKVKSFSLLNPGENTLLFPDLPPAIYVIQVEANGQIWHEKISLL